MGGRPHQLVLQLARKAADEIETAILDQWRYFEGFPCFDWHLTARS